MRRLYVIGRDGWVWDMSNTQWLDMDSSHGVGECSVTVVCPLAGVHSDRPRNGVIRIVIVSIICVHVVWGVFNFVVIVGVRNCVCCIAIVIEYCYSIASRIPPGPCRSKARKHDNV